MKSAASETWCLSLESNTTITAFAFSRYWDTFRRKLKWPGMSVSASNKDSLSVSDLRRVLGSLTSICPSVWFKSDELTVVGLTYESSL